MAAKRPAQKSQSQSTSSTASPVFNAVLLAAAALYGVWMLVARGRMSWPPTDLAANLFTVAGCIALVGPIVLYRREPAEPGVGETVWLTSGLLLWVFNAAALVRGEGRWSTLATPMSAGTLGLIMLAVAAAAWRSHAGGKNWSWTNVTGWALGLFWIGLALAAYAPGTGVRLAMR
jgi:hypothetical protein